MSISINVTLLFQSRLRVLTQTSPVLGAIFGWNIFVIKCAVGGVAGYCGVNWSRRWNMPFSKGVSSFVSHKTGRWRDLVLRELLLRDLRRRLCFRRFGFLQGMIFGGRELLYIFFVLPWMRGTIRYQYKFRNRYWAELIYHYCSRVFGRMLS